MRENCLYGSEGGGDRATGPSYPYQQQRDKHTVWMPAFAGMTVAGWPDIELAGKAPQPPIPDTAARGRG
jgi:hypothetical protein